MLSMQIPRSSLNNSSVGGNFKHPSYWGRTVMTWRTYRPPTHITESTMTRCRAVHQAVTAYDWCRAYVRHSPFIGTLRIMSSHSCKRRLCVNVRAPFRECNCTRQTQQPDIPEQNLVTRGGVCSVLSPSGTKTSGRRLSPPRASTQLNGKRPSSMLNRSRK